jgi:hypothetical protein
MVNRIILRRSLGFVLRHYVFLIRVAKFTSCRPHIRTGNGVVGTLLQVDNKQSSISNCLPQVKVEELRSGLICV